MDQPVAVDQILSALKLDAADEGLEENFFWTGLQFTELENGTVWYEIRVPGSWEGYMWYNVAGESADKSAFPNY